MAFTLQDLKTQRLQALKGLQAQGFEKPKYSQIMLESKKIGQERRLQEAQQKIQDVKEKAQTGKGRNINMQPLDLIQQQAQQIMQNKFGLSGDYTQALGLGISRQLGRVPETVSAFPEFKGASFGAQMNAIEAERAGLTGTLGGIGRILKERQETQEKKTEALNQRRQNAIKEYMDFKQRIISEGGTPDLKAGQDLINKIQQSENPEVELSDYFSVAAPFVQKLFAPKKMGGGSDGGTIASVNLYSDIMQQAINAGATTADEVVAGIQAVANTTGVNLSIKDLNAIKDKAKILLGNKETIANLPQLPQLSKIEQDIAQLKKGNILKDSDIRYSLKKRGYSTEEINQSSVGGIIDSISSYIFGE